ncbi:hypothetical protein E4U38_008258, partial [Claviceps purpurea]
MNIYGDAMPIGEEVSGIAFKTSPYDAAGAFSFCQDFMREDCQRVQPDDDDETPTIF